MKTTQKTSINSSKRVFMLHALMAANGAVLTTQLSAQTMVSESDSTAASLGYKADATKVDKAKYAKYAAGQACNNCALYQGTASAAAGGCPLFAGKQVAGKGWCSAWVKKG